MTCLKVYQTVSIVCLLAAVCQHADCHDTLVISVDNAISKVCVAPPPWPPRDLTGQLKNAKRINKIDRVTIPDDECINIQATNVRGWPGIAAYINKAKAVNWRCLALKQVPNKDCCGIAVSNGAWRKAGLLKYSINKHHKKQYRWRLQNRLKYWRWAKKLGWKKVCCQICKCASFCRSCVSAGPDKCDRNQCYYGTATNKAGAQVCRSKCTIEIRSSGTSMPVVDRTGYVKVTHAVTGIETVYSPTMGEGQYAYKLDICTCALYDGYHDVSGNLLRQMIRSWNTDPTNENVLVIQYNYATATTGPYGPFCGLSILSGGAPSRRMPLASALKKYKNTITGVCDAAYDNTYSDPTYSTYTIPAATAEIEFP